MTKEEKVELAGECIALLQERETPITVPELCEVVGFQRNQWRILKRIILAQGHNLTLGEQGYYLGEDGDQARMIVNTLKHVGGCLTSLGQQLEAIWLGGKLKQTQKVAGELSEDLSEIPKRLKGFAEDLSPDVVKELTG